MLLRPRAVSYVNVNCNVTNRQWLLLDEKVQEVSSPVLESVDGLCKCLSPGCNSAALIQGKSWHHHRYSASHAEREIRALVKDGTERARIMFQDLEGTGVTVNVLLPGGPVNSRMVPADCGIDPEDLIQPDQLAEPVRWLCSNEANDVTGLRLVARHWDSRLSPRERLAQATAPIAWPQLGAQSHIPVAKA